MPDQVRISYAQNGEDVRVWRALRHLERGFYVEVGASDPVVDSTTAALREAGWSGLLIEPDAAMAERLRVARPEDTVVAAAAYSRSGVLAFDPGADRGLGSVTANSGGTHSGTPVPAVRVADLLDDLQPATVHFMSVDVEGAELAALEGADLARWQPWVLSVEATKPNSREPAWQAWEPLVLDAGYTLVTFDGLNRWYVARGFDDLTHELAQPLNALDQNLDGWVRRKEHLLAQQVTQLLQHIDALEAAQAATVAGLQADLRQHQEELRQQRLAAVAEAEQREEQAEVRLRAALTEQAGQLEHELQSVVAERDAALIRERILLTSKSWRLTKPLRSARVTGAVALRPWRGAAPAGLALAGSAGSAAPPDTPAQARRRVALAAKVQAARRRAGT